MDSCERRLAWAIEGVEKDRLLIRYFKIDPSDPEREASFVIDIGGDNFKGTYPADSPVNALIQRIVQS